MSIINRYIITRVLLATLFVLLVLFGVSIFIEMSNELRAVGKGDYTVFRAFYYVLLIVPNDLYLFFPMAGLIGSLVGLGLLSNNNELLVFRASGMSVLSIAKSVMLAALILSIFMLLIGEVLVPKFNSHADRIRSQALYGHQSISTQRGVWIKQGNNFIHITRVLNQNLLQQVTRYQFDNNHKLLQVSYADNIKLDGDQWVADKMKTTIITDQKISATVKPNSPWGLALDPKVLASNVANPMQMSIPQLVKFIHYQKEMGLETKSYWVTFYQRIFQPLACLVMIFLAVPFVFGSARSGTLGYRILIGAVWGMAFYLFSQFSGQFSVVYNIPAYLGAGLPILFFAFVGLWLMHRVK